MKYRNNNKKNIAIIGHMGSGKSILGSLIAKTLKIDHLDSDQIIELKTGMTISEIFKEKGESAFRSIEKKTILNIDTKKNFVLSLGGGSILSAQIREFLKKYFITIFLDVNMAILVKRLSKSSKRPILYGVNIKEKIKELDLARRKYYLLADIRFEKNESINKSLASVLSILNKQFKINEKNYNSKN